jgi:hypothetical protein
MVSVTPATPISAGPHSPLHERLVSAAGSITYRALGELTGVHAENVRRYMQGQAPSTEFLAAFCKQLGINGEWILTGRGPMKVAEVKAEALTKADPGELLGALAGTVQRLTQRVELIEMYTQTLDTRLRARQQRPGPAGDSAGAGGENAHEHTSSKPAGVPGIVTRSAYVADALAKRSRPDAG